MLLDKITGINSDISSFLQTKIISYASVEVNLWHLVHFLSGFLLMFVIVKRLRKFKYKYSLLLELLILWGLSESFVRYFGVNFLGFLVFTAESVQDILLDITLGFFGGFLYIKFFSKMPIFK